MLISPTHFRVLAYTLDVEGHDSKAVLHACDLSHLDSLPDEQWLPLEQFERMIQLALDESMEPSLGLTAGASVAQTRYSVIYSVILQMPNLRQGLADIELFARLVLPRAEVSLQEIDGQALLRIDPIVQEARARQFRTESIMTSMVQMLRFCGATPQDIQSIDFAYPQPGHVHRYAATFGPTIRFDQDVSRVTFHPALLDRPIAWHDPATYKSMRLPAERALAAMQGDNGLSARLRDIIHTHLPKLLKVSEVAQQLGMNERSLKSHLATMNKSYAQMVQECQIALAKQMLLQEQDSLKDIADQLGYASVSCFHRAFRRWTDETPTHWRLAQQNPLTRDKQIGPLDAQSKTKG